MFLWDELRGFPRPILIYGMGNGADKILALCREYGISITGIFSSDTHAREGMFQGCPVLSRTKALEQYPNAIILLGFGTERPDEVADLLELAERHPMRIPDTPLLGGTILTLDDLSARQAEIQQVSDLWADEQSRQLFRSLLEAKLSGDPKALMANTSPRSELLELLHLARRNPISIWALIAGIPLRNFYRSPRAVIGKSPHWSRMPITIRSFRKLGAALTVSPFCPMPAGMPKPP